MRFKKGDKVRRVNSQYKAMIHNCEDVVRLVYRSGLGKETINLVHFGDGHIAANFILVDRPNDTCDKENQGDKMGFKKNDIAICKENDLTDLTKGKEYVVLDIRLHVNTNININQILIRDNKEMYWRNADQFKLKPSNVTGKIADMGGKAMDQLKNYFNEHRNVFLTLGIIILVDYFVLNKSLTGRIAKIVDATMSRVEKAISGEVKED